MIKNYQEKFAEYHLKNWDNMPCLRGAGICGNGYVGYFFPEAKEYIDKFMVDNKIKVETYNSFEDYVSKNGK